MSMNFTHANALPPSSEARYVPGLLSLYLTNPLRPQWLLVYRAIVPVAARTGVIADMLKSVI